MRVGVLFSIERADARKDARDVVVVVCMGLFLGCHEPSRVHGRTEIH